MKTINLKKTPEMKAKRTESAARLIILRKAMQLKGLSPEAKLIIRQRAQKISKEHKKP